MKRIYSHVLLADDDYDDCDFFEEAFTASFPDIKLSISNNGGKLMEHLNRPPEPLADIIFLDLNMPVKNGVECLAEIRSDSALQDNVVVIFTTSSNPEDIEKLYRLGANYFITKPVDFNDLPVLIEKAMSRVAQSGTTPPSFEDFYIRC